MAGTEVANGEQLYVPPAVKPCHPNQCQIFHWFYEIYFFWGGWGWGCVQLYLNM